MHVATHQFRFQARAFDPRKDDGPLMLNKLHLNNVHCTKGGMYLSGLKTGGMLLFNGREVQMAVELPPGTHNARPFRDGVLFNDTDAERAALRRPRRRRARIAPCAVPTYPAESLLNGDVDQSGVARQGFARGLAVLSDTLVAGGSSPSTVSVYDLAAERARAFGQPDDGRAKRHPRPRGLALLASPALRTLSGSSAMMSASSSCHEPRCFS